ncbi:hypothetical protein CPB85DRAFT_813458 [Mucidula mucida]|nr:hypothetical protein CPB85DRAFT_813458 [Mucidula mucida]
MFQSENGFVDLSAFLVEGENKIEISQDRNLSQYAVAIFVHSPTRQQLETVVARRKKDQQWNTFLRDLGKPLVLEPTKCPWSVTSA